MTRVDAGDVAVDLVARMGEARGGFWSDPTDGERAALAAALLEAEREALDHEWDALAVHLERVSPDGGVDMPEDWGEFRRWVAATVRLGWNVERPADPWCQRDG